MFYLDPTFVLRMRHTTTMIFICTPLKESPPAILATCYWGKRPVIILTHTLTRMHTHKHTMLFKATVKHKDWGQDTDPFPFKQLSWLLWKTSAPPIPLQRTLTIYLSPSLQSSLPLHMCHSHTKFLLNSLNGIGTQRTAPHGLSHSKNDWVVSPTEDTEEKCLSHFSTSSRRRMGTGDKITAQRIYTGTETFSKDI